MVILGLLAVGALLACAIRMLVGGAGPGWSSDPAIVELRALRAAAGAAVGGALGLAGAQLQALLRNPLASPDLLGMSSGAGLAVVLTALVGGGLALGSPVPATIGALATLGVVYAAAQRRGLIEPVSLVLIGVITGVVLGAATMAAQSLMGRDGAYAASRWMLGAISDDTRWVQIAGCVVLIGGALGLSAWLGPRVDGAAFGDDEAHALGVRLGSLRVVLFAVSGVLTAASVVLAGPVGFVGLVCPHVVRLLIGPTHRALAIGAALAGSMMVVLADALVHAVRLPTGRPPIGVVTALIGGPVFLVLLRAQMRGRG